MRYLFLLLFLPHGACSQPTAQDSVPCFDEPFGYGVNLGYFPPHFEDKALAALVHGTPDGAEAGTGINTIRPGLYAHFLEQWGYDARLPHFEYYKKIGLDNIVAIIGFPSEKQRDTILYDLKNPSALFRNLYEPIWDNGANGTPINENNPYAVYVWKMARMYKGLIKIWEVWNEPDYGLQGNEWKAKGQPGNWWENNPTPAETNLHAPIFGYIRTLRISYEVIKSIDPQALVAVGGLGWPPYLDAICRNTDNPDNGVVKDEFPLKGGAYFDCMSYHCYPHLDNSTRQWSNTLNGFKYTRHSDAAVAGLWQKKRDFDVVLNKHGFDNRIYPKKHWICTEYNVPRKRFGEYMGSDLAQINFVIKSLVTAQVQGVAQMHLYSLADDQPEATATGEFAYMGLFKNLNGVKKGAAEPNLEAFAVHTTALLLDSTRYDSIQTSRLNIPKDLDGAAFKKTNGQFVYVLWARTQTDLEETAQGSFTFPANMEPKKLRKYAWDYSKTRQSEVQEGKTVLLNGSPVFLVPDL